MEVNIYLAVQLIEVEIVQLIGNQRRIINLILGNWLENEYFLICIYLIHGYYILVLGIFAVSLPFYFWEVFAIQSIIK